MAALIDHLSVSQLKLYLLCPLKYWYRYVAKVPAPLTSELTLGRSVHAALELNFRQKVTTQQDVSLGVVTDAFSDTWEREAKETRFDKNEQPGQVKDEGVAIVGNYHSHVAPAIQPVAVERPFELTFANVPYTFKGRVDLVETGAIIRDHKVTRRAPTPAQVAQDLQLTAYSLAHRVQQGTPETRLQLDVMVRTKQPKVLHLPTTRQPADHTRFLKLLGYVAKGIQGELFYPNVNFTCPSCPYRQQCDAWQNT